MHWICTVTGTGKPCGSQKVPWLRELENIGIGHGVSLLCWRPRRYAALPFHAADFRPQLLPASTRLRGGLKAARTKLE